MTVFRSFRDTPQKAGPRLAYRIEQPAVTQDCSTVRRGKAVAAIIGITTDSSKGLRLVHGYYPSVSGPLKVAFVLLILLLRHADSSSASSREIHSMSWRRFR